MANGARVYISGRDAKACQATSDELNKCVCGSPSPHARRLGPGKAIPLPADLQKYEEVERLVQELQKHEKGAYMVRSCLTHQVLNVLCVLGHSCRH